MKIGIQGHFTRGKEIIQILESLGGINDGLHKGNNPNYYYELHNNIIWCVSTKNIHFKYYTLEEFEKEFPFKIGDRVESLTTGFIGTIKKFSKNGCYYVKYDNGNLAFTFRKNLKLCKEMKEERNITLTLDKAKEWYNKGGELKEIALRAFTEKELNSLPRSWEEFCEKYPIKPLEAVICSESTIVTCDCSDIRDSDGDREICPSKKSVEAHLAMIQLEQLRNCYNDNSDAWGWSYSIIKRNGIPELVRGCDHDTFLRFKNEVIAIEFLKNFRDLIEKAGDLI